MKFACFIHPEIRSEDFDSDICPKCQKSFLFPIEEFPEKIGEFKVIKPLDRGFYSAAYIVEAGPFKRNQVIKVVPVSIYSFYKKDFVKECEEHALAAEGSEHIINIIDRKLNVEVDFKGIKINCHFAVLDFVDGETLREFLLKDEDVDAITIAQLSMDMFALLEELRNKDIFHNDLHTGNLVVQKLNNKTRRADAEDPFVRLVAIDFNSVSDKSKSDPGKSRLNDLHYIVRHLNELTEHLLKEPEKTSDLNYRLAAILSERAALLSPVSTSQRLPAFDECIQDIRQAIHQQFSPWTEKPMLRKFNDGYNAQTLSSWFVPYLLVDPDQKWLTAISTQGPQVITGMRGCGKTMLLRALQFHARATFP